MKELYEKPAMLTEKVEPQTLVAQVTGGPVSPIPQMQPFFGLCCP